MFRRLLTLAAVVAVTAGLHAPSAHAVLGTEGTLALQLNGLNTGLDPITPGPSSFVWSGTGVLATTTGQQVMYCEAWSYSYGSVLSEFSTATVNLACDGSAVDVNCRLTFNRTGPSMILQGECDHLLGTRTDTTTAIGELAWSPSYPPGVPVFWYAMAGTLALVAL